MTYPGGKSGAGVYQTIINQMPPHDTYIEPFAGHGGVMLNKRPAVRNIAVDLDPNLAEFWRDRPGIEWVNGCAVDYLAAFPFTGRELIYCDPPYVHSTRKGTPDLYNFEMSDPQHESLLACLLDLPCMVLISGYESALYAARLGSWRTLDHMVNTRQGLVQERLWLNFPEPEALHDYSHIGGDYKERWLISKLARRWVRRFDALPPLTRKAILSRLADLDRAEP